MLTSKYILFISIPLLFLISGVLLAVNGIFYFTEFKNSIEVELYGGSAKGMSMAVSKIVNLPNIAKIDRERGGVPIFQNLSVEEVRKLYDNMLNSIEDAPSYHIREIIKADFGYLESYLLAQVSFVVFFIMSHFVFFVRKDKSITKLKDVVLLYSIFASASFIVSFLGIGFLSLLSTKYAFNEVELAFSFVGIFALSILFLISSRKTLNQKLELSVLSQNLYNLTDSLKSKIIFVLLTLIFFIIILSENFVIPGSVIIINILLAILVSKWMGLLLRLNKQKITKQIFYWFKNRNYDEAGQTEAKLQTLTKQKKKKKTNNKNIKNRI